MSKLKLTERQETIVRNLIGDSGKLEAKVTESNSSETIIAVDSGISLVVPSIKLEAGSKIIIDNDLNYRILVSVDSKEPKISTRTGAMYNLNQPNTNTKKVC